MRKTYLPLIIGTLMGVCAQAALAGGVYKWVDANGALHFSEVNRHDSERISREYLSKREIPARGQIVPAEFARKVAQDCENSKERLSNYRSATTLYQRDPGGNRVAFTDRQVRLLLAETERDERNYCQANAAEKLYAEQRARIHARAAALAGKS